MVGKTRHHPSPSLVEELNLLYKPKGSPDGAGGEAWGSLGQWKCRLFGYLSGQRSRRARCVVCLQVQHVAGLSPAVEGRGIVVGWRSKGCDGEHTAPVMASRGAAAFDEVFLHYFSAASDVLPSFTVWAALVDSEDGDLGAFPVDLGELAVAESSNPRFGSKAVSFALGGAAAGAVLTISVYCRVMDQEENHGTTGHAGERKNKGKRLYSSCLPDLGCLRNRPEAGGASGSARRATSLRSDRGGFITIENSMADVGGGGLRVEDDEEGAGFITMEKGTISSRSRRPPSDNLGTTDEDDAGVPEDEKPCLFMEVSEDAAFDVEKVEDEFLAMLEEKYWTKSREIEKGLGVSLDIGLDLDLDLDALIKEAEMELAKAEQAWKSRVGAAIVEEEEYEELLRRWRSTTTTNASARDSPNCSSGCSWGFGFGSPI